MFTVPYKKFYTGFNHHKLSAIEKIILIEIYDRMEYSHQSKEFFDSERGDYYVIYPINELSEILEISSKTAEETIKSLVEKGWLITNGNNRIFISPDKQNLD